MPFRALTVLVPLRVPAGVPGFVPMAIVIAAVLVTIRLPNESCTLTVTAGEMLLPATVLVGCVPNASLLAAAGATVIPVWLPVMLLVVVVVAVIAWVPAVFSVALKVCAPLSTAAKV